MSATPDPFEISRRLVDELRDVEFQEPISHVYQPLEYAREPYEQYLEKFGTDRPREVLMVGMNPGPWGMGQNGVPFGAMEMVEEWMEIGGEVGQPEDPHPERPVTGFECDRNEVSGSRLWGWARERFGSAEAFFDRFFVHNYCPLLILEESGKNRTPSRLRKAERQQVVPPCDRALRAMVDYYRPEFVVGVGSWAGERIEEALVDHGFEGTYGKVLHPSPASPKANRGWASQAEDQLRELGVELEG